jgi:uroporphyrinogen decarboxylase
MTPKQCVLTAIAHREPDRAPADTVAYCRRTLEIMMPGGGYCFAPTHSLQENSPTENVVAMYETARTAGVYS